MPSSMLNTAVEHPPPGLQAFGIESHWLTQRPAQRRLLIVYAHPDDESFGNAGTIARYASEGVGVDYACATRGECGTVAPALLQGYADIASLRTAELNCAARALDMASVHFLGHLDSGMPGAPENQHPCALEQAPLEQVAGQITALIRALRPQVVLTFPPYGGYGHPDHIKVHHAAVAAFAASGDGARFPEQAAAGLVPWSASKLYYSTLGTAWLRTGIALLRLVRRDPRRFGQNHDVDLLRVLEEATPVTTSINTKAFGTQKQRAWRCHRSQLGGMEQRWLRLPAVVRRVFESDEHFTRVSPPWDNHRPLERDLFAGLET
ncbi:MAG: 1D-myo-inositol 2-acetamido-2-deoxy-alpha-D-glucopyranoside deacetylase [uncultured Chloroflexia bacterium]|uniref:1D-myo-inositol 2-acetamido-2-deoxy-alpha-D-glucopyranoside deacetylase n=1 Tax=uncultured Chloroflexia bacterium TaxID=1672391 RepID=A0A6J4IH66_9CHLR|nr:MAG: 1D-myo-inositol 2-acetamido-2-deoxy-alpha-D-glucopyranoside deacetylase [uncultured Chloroflexia bacterium]